MKQETLEEAAEKWVFETNGNKWSNNDDTCGDNYSSFMAGAEWQKEQAERHFEDKGWAEVNVILLVNFLKMPDAHKIHLLESIKERRPDLFESKPETEMKQETAVEWFASEMSGHLGPSNGPELMAIFDRAKAMEKVQISQLFQSKIMAYKDRLNEAIANHSDPPNEFTNGYLVALRSIATDIELGNL